MPSDPALVLLVRVFLVLVVLYVGEAFVNSLRELWRGK